MKININVVLAQCTLCYFRKFFTIILGIGTYFAYFYWYLKKDDVHAMLDTRTETTIY